MVIYSNKISYNVRLNVFNVLLIFTICLQDKTINFIKLDKLIETNTCLLDGLLKVILILGFSFLSLLITLYTSLIVLNKRLGKFSLILMISLILEENACIYDCPLWVLIFLTGNLSFPLKNFDFSRTFLLGLSGISKGIL